jgi:hypothetical protein
MGVVVSLLVVCLVIMCVRRRRKRKAAKEASVQGLPAARFPSILSLFATAAQLLVPNMTGA